jgi:hypothetical protein
MMNKTKYLLLIAILLAVYYFVCGVYLHSLGYYSQEALFYVEKSKILFEGLGYKLNLMGLTAPILPFFSSFFFSVFHTGLFAPLIASSFFTALLFFILASTLITRANDFFYVFILLIIFLLHPGILYAASSGKSISMVLIFFFLFFFNLFKFYNSNATYHLSIASIFFVFLVFCEYKFIWLILFFIPILLPITIESLNLREEESIFRLFMTYRNPSLRRKLISKTFALSIILFALPLTCLLVYKLLNLTYAHSLDFFNDNPYGTWTVLANKLNFDQISNSSFYELSETSILISIKILVFCPMIVLSFYLLRKRIYQVLTVLTPFAFVEFLHIKYEQVFLEQQYYLIFLVLSLLCVLYKSGELYKKPFFKLLVSVLTIAQLYTGFVFLKNSSIEGERGFISVLLNQPSVDTHQQENLNMASYLDRLPDDSHVLVDDAVAYPVVAFTSNIHKLILPYQSVFLSAVETPDRYDDYVLLATGTNEVRGFTQLDDRYTAFMKGINGAIRFQKVYESDDWVLYKIFDN